MPVQATHFRYGHLTWRQRPDVSPTAVEFSLVNAFRRNGYPGSGNDGLPIIGDVINEDIGGTDLLFGDGASTGQLSYRVISFDPTENWLIGVALDPISGQDKVLHAYAAQNDSGQPWIAAIDSCCRISTLANAPDGNYRVETLVDLTKTDHSPVSSLPPIVSCPQSSLCSLLIPGADFQPGTQLRWRLATGSEDGGITQPGGLTVDAATGTVTWNTAGAPLNSLWAAQAIIEKQDAVTGAVLTKVAVDYLVRIVAPGTPPVIEPPPNTPPVCATTHPVRVGESITFVVTASHPDPHNIVTLNTAGLPAGATTTPSLPASGNPVSTTFNWTPTAADIRPQAYLINFTATDTGGLQASCPVTVTVEGFDVVDPNNLEGGSAPILTVQGELTTDVNTLLSAHSAKIKGVAADGATQLLLIFEGDQSTSDLTFSLGGGLADGGFKEIGSSASPTASLQVQAQSIGPRRVAFAVYSSPVNFRPIASADSARDISLQVAVGSAPAVERARLSLVRPPVVLVHGIWSNPKDAWVSTGFKRLLTDAGFRVTLADYGDCNYCDFDPAADGPPIRAVRDAIRSALGDDRKLGTAVSQVDVFAHSMGGVVTRAYASWATQPYERGENFLRGDIHKLITVGTPHHGTPLANWFVGHGCDWLIGFENWQAWLASYKGNHCVANCQRISAFFECLGKELGEAVVDLQTNSHALERIGTTHIPSHAIVCTEPSSSLFGTESLLNWVPEESCNNGTTIDGLLGGEGNHDTIVPVGSQKGGLPDSAVTVQAGIVHQALSREPDETSSLQVALAGIDLLNGPIDEAAGNFAHFGPWPSVGTPSVPVACGSDACPSSCPGGGGGGAATGLAHPATSSPALGQNVAVTFLPMEGLLVRPGETVQFDFTVADGNPVAGAVFFIGAVTVVTSGPGPFAFSWIVPSNAIGRIDVLTATYGQGPTNYAASTSIFVQPDATLTGIEVLPQALDLYYSPQQARLYVTGHFSDGIDRDISSPELGTSYDLLSGTNLVVALTSDGLVAAKGNGQDAIIVSNAARTNTIPVRVNILNHRPALNPIADLTVIAGGTVDVPVTHGARGERRVVTVKTDQSRIVSTGAREGYLERRLASRQGYVSRTYVLSDRTDVHVYRTYVYHGVTCYHYVPAVYYHPVFYGWVYDPWPAPVSFAWGWGPAPWYGYYGAYFVAAPAYPTPALWLTDYLLAENLRASYEARMAAGTAVQPAPAPAPQASQDAGNAISPEIKQAIAEEVRQQLAAEKAAASQPSQPAAQTAPSVAQATPAALDPKHRIFVVSGNVSITTGGQTCVLNSGDIIIRNGETTADGTKAQVSVLNSKEGSCPVGSIGEVEIADLQEMHNQFRQHIDSGLKKLADNQGSGGLPNGPAANPRQVEEAQAAPDSKAQEELRKQNQEATKFEAEAQKEAHGQSGA